MNIEHHQASWGIIAQTVPRCPVSPRVVRGLFPAKTLMHDFGNEKHMVFTWCLIYIYI